MAKRNQAEIKITARNELKAGLHDAMDELGKFGKVVEGLGKLTIGAGIGAALYKLGEAAKACVDNFTETEDTYLRMAKALGRDDYNKAIKSLNKFSRYTKASRDELAAMMSTMTAMGKTSEEMDKITTAAISLSNVTGKDLNSSFEIMLDSLNGSTGEIEKFLPQVKDLTEEEKKLGGAIDEVINKFGDLSEATSIDSLSQVKKNMEDSMVRIGQSIGSILTSDLLPVFEWAEDWLDDIANRFEEMAQDRQDVREGNITSKSNPYVFSHSSYTPSIIEDWDSDVLEDLLHKWEEDLHDEKNKGIGYSNGVITFPSISVINDLNDSINIITRELKNRGYITTINDAFESLGNKIEDSSIYSQDIVSTFENISADNIISAITKYKGSQAGLKSPHITVWTVLEQRLYKEWENKITTLKIALASKAGSGSVGDDEDALAKYFDDTAKEIKSHEPEIDAFFESLFALFTANEVDFGSAEMQKGIKGINDLGEWLEGLGSAGTLSEEYFRLDGYKEALARLQNPYQEDILTDIPTHSFRTDLLNLQMPVDMMPTAIKNGLPFKFDIPEPVTPKPSKGSYWVILEDIDKTIGSFKSFLNPQTKSEWLSYYEDQEAAVQAQYDELLTYSGDNSERANALLKIIEAIKAQQEELNKEIAAENKQAERAENNKSILGKFENLFEDKYGESAKQTGVDNIFGGLLEAAQPLIDIFDQFFFAIESGCGWLMILIPMIEGFVGTIMPMIKSVLAPIMDFLRLIGSTIADYFLPIFNSLIESVSRVVQIVGDVLLPILDMLAPVMELIASILDVLHPILQAVAWMFGVLMIPVKALATTFDYVIHAMKFGVDWLVAWIHNIFNWFDQVEIPNWNERMGQKGEDLKDAWDFEKQYKDLEEHLSGPAGSQMDGSTQTAVSNATYNGGVSVTLNVYQNAPVVGEDGMDEFATMIRNKFLELDYMGR